MILLAGANGRLGRHIIRQFGSGKVVAAVRRPQNGDLGIEEIIIGGRESIHEVPWHRFRTVINAAGTTAGDTERFASANVEFPLNLAKAAKAGGVRRFIHISSFSIYGNVERIALGAVEAPVSDYAKSKARCDTLLQELSNNSFGVLSIRVPFMFSESEPALFHPLLSMLSRMPVLLTTNTGIQRSMITYAGAARLFAHFADREIRGVICAAAHQPFDIPMLARIIADETGRTLRKIVVSDTVARLFLATIPSISRRLLQSSILASSANAALDIPDLEGVDAMLRILVRKYMAK